MTSNHDKGKIVEVTGRGSSDYMYTLRWKDGYSSRYPFVWLLDHCRCPICFHPSSKQKRKSMDIIDPEVRPIAEEIAQDGALFKITWADDHIGEYPTPWLRQHRFDHGTVFDPISDLKMKPWGSELADKIPKFKYNEVMENDEVLYEWLRALYETGLAVITGAPAEAGVLWAVTTRVGYLKETHYGKLFQVHSKFETSNVAYTTDTLGLHVDEPYFTYCPGVQMLHCIRQFQGRGGDNQFSDGYNAALTLKKNNPDIYRILTTVHVSYRDCGTDHIKYHMIGAKPTIEEDREGNFKQVFYSDIVRASFMNVPVEKIQDVYRAMKLLHEAFYKHVINYKLKPGEIATFNNTRVLHGRTGFTIDQSSPEAARHFEGLYMDWDQVFSRLRVLQEEKNGELRL